MRLVSCGVRFFSLKSPCSQLQGFSKEEAEMHSPLGCPGCGKAELPRLLRAGSGRASHRQDILSVDIRNSGPPEGCSCRHVER